ncbi:MAG TPA: SRPBCC family protein [Acidimicrobiales bacterium]|nr:SRPBCC family protein [Acidimicrobiales bacterium]
MSRTDRCSRLIDAPADRVFAALIDRDALLSWLPPTGMTASFAHFDPRPGGSYRLVLSYDDPAGAPGKASADSDVVDVRFVDIVPGERIVQAVDFESDDPAFAGTMTMTWTVSTDPGGTLVTIIATDVPDGITAEDHATGMASSLANLARYLAS